MFKLGRITFWKGVFAAVVLLGIAATLVRFGLGLGASTNLSDEVPWGLWIGFDVMVGVALAAGGFTIAATVHIFHIEKYEPVARPAVLTAFMGYLLVIVGLLFDIGQPWDIWHPLVWWNPHSVMFEVAWCVMLYATVLALEFSPVVLEKFNLKVPLKIIRTIYLPLVVLGVLLSMMHQSSLGSLFLIVPDKLYGLWYTPWLPVFFFVSAVAAGLAMTIVESYLSHRAFGRKLEDDLLRGLARATVVVLAVYGLWRIQDLSGRGGLGLAFQLTPEAVMWWGEMALGVALPMVLMASRKVRNNQHALFFAALLAVMGTMVNRLNVGITGMARATGTSYFPSVWELGVTLTLVVVGFAGFAFAVRYLDLFPKEEMERARPPAETPALGLRGMPTANGWGLVGVWVLAAVGAGLLFLSQGSEATVEAPEPSTPEAAAAAVPAPDDLVLPVDYTFPQSEDSPGPVTFSHDSHVEYADRSCAACHRDQFSLKQAGQPLWGKVNHDRFEQGQLCGACHDGEQAFGLEEGCDTCHQ